MTSFDVGRVYWAHRAAGKGSMEACQAVVDQALTEQAAKRQHVEAHVEDVEALSDLLLHLNETGTDTQVSGIDDSGSTFLACLAGPYAETVVVLAGSPWDPEVEYGTGTYCTECNAANLLKPEALRYPVTVVHREVSL